MTLPALRLALAGLALATGAAQAAPADHEYRADGSVRVGSQVFPTLEAWHRSALFRESGARCGTYADPAIERLAKSDCDLAGTKINQEYNDGRTLVIPVVVHVIKNTQGVGDISPALVQSQIDIMNEDFNALANTPGAMGTDAKIQFVLAKLDPMGNPTTGINVVTNDDYFNGRGNAAKQALHWDTKRFLNIYTNNPGPNLLGYATFPSETAGKPQDGVVMNWRYFGRDVPDGAPYDKGRTATHEVGHYLGLHHTFNSGCGSASAPYTTADLIADTAREAEANYGCAAVASGCSGGGMSPIENYMNYSEDACMTKFTPEQVNRMRCSIINYRWVNTPPTAAFTYTATELEATFTSTSTDAESTPDALKYSWTFGDGMTSTEPNPVHTFATAGTYEVTLEVLDPGSGTSRSKQMVMVAPLPPDAGPGAGNSDDAGMPGGDSNQPGGCCDAPGSGASALLCSMPVMLAFWRRRRVVR